MSNQHGNNVWKSLKSNDLCVSCNRYFLYSFDKKNFYFVIKTNYWSVQSAISFAILFPLNFFQGAKSFVNVKEDHCSRGPGAYMKFWSGKFMSRKFPYHNTISRKFLYHNIISRNFVLTDFHTINFTEINSLK